MNIGLLIYNLKAGGAERVLCKWSDLLSENNNIYMYTYDGKSSPEYSFSGTMKVMDAPSKGKGKFKQITNLFLRYVLLRKQLKKDQIDLLISFCSTANFPTMFQKIPRIASIRLYSEYFSYRKIYRFLIKNTTCKLVVQTKRLKNDILKDVGGRYESKIFVMDNPLDLQTIKSKSEDRAEDEFYNKIAKKKVICFTGSFKASKNHWNLLKSFYLLHQEIKDSVLVLIGAGGELEEKIKEMASNSEISDSVIFLGKKENPFMYEKKADLFVLPSLYEGIPNVLIEAMAIGLPIIATDCPSGPKEILCENPNLSSTTCGVDRTDYGILIQPFENKKDFSFDTMSEGNYILAREMKKMLIDKELNDYYRQQAKIRAMSYDMNEYSVRLIELISDCT